MKTDSVSEAITETIPQALSGVGEVVEIIPDAVSTTVSRTRRLWRAVPWPRSRSLSRRWWVLAGIVGVISAATAVWIVRRPRDLGHDAGADASTVSGEAPRRAA